MSLRVTHQWVDVLRGGDASARITRQYIEALVLPSDFDEEASESITVSDSVVSSFHIVNATETITVSDSAVAAIEYDDVPVTDLITVVDTAISSIKAGAATDSITVIDLAAGVNTTKAVTAIETLLIADSAVAGGTTNTTVVEGFLPDDYVTKTRFFTDPTTGQLVPIGYVDESSIQDSLTYEVIRGVTAIRESIVVSDIATHYLIVATGDHEETCTEAITVTDTSSVTDHLVQCTESIAVTDGAVPETSLPATESITVTDSIDLEIIANKTFTETISVYETLAYEVVSGISLCSYHPFIGGITSPSLPTAPSSTPPTETPQGDFQFYWPIGAPTETLTLSGPEADDREGLHVQRIRRTSRGLSLHVYADPQWPKVRRLSIGVDVCTEALAQEILDFVQTTLGQEVGFRDWHNRSWQGVIDNPQSVVTRTKLGSWTVAIEFEAETTEI